MKNKQTQTTTEKQVSNFTKELLKAFITDETTEKSFKLAELVRAEMICKQEGKHVNQIKCSNITEYLLIKQVMFLINNDKSKAYKLESDFKTLSFNFSVFTENLSNQAIKYFNYNYGLNIPENKQEDNARDEEVEEALQNLYSLGIV